MSIKTRKSIEKLIIIGQKLISFAKINFSIIDYSEWFFEFKNSIEIDQNRF